ADARRLVQGRRRCARWAAFGACSRDAVRRPQHAADDRGAAWSAKQRSRCLCRLAALSRIFLRERRAMGTPQAEGKWRRCRPGKRPDRRSHRGAGAKGLQGIRSHPRRACRDGYRHQGLQGRHHLGGRAMSAATTTPALRPFLPADTPVLAAIFSAAIEELTGDDYSDAQQEAWAAVADDEVAFGKKLAGELTLIATLKNAPVGFAS